MMKYRRIYFTGLLAILTLIMISPVDVVAQNRADVIQLGSEFMVVDDNKVRIYYQTGAQNGSDISTAGRADVQTLGSNFIVVDDNGIRIIYRTGDLIKYINMNGRPDIIQLGSRFMAVGDNIARIYYQTGEQKGNDISTAGRADVQTLGSNFIVVDDNGIRIIYQTGEQKGGVISMDVSSGSSAVDLSEIDLSHNGEIDIWDVAVIAEYFGQMVQ